MSKSKSKDLTQIGRLALRQEGGMWAAYYAPMDTMEGAIFLGSIRMAIVQDESRRSAFMEIMREAVADMLKEATGLQAEWPNPPQPAPEHERGGNA
jgi:hypothetical protein